MGKLLDKIAGWDPKPEGAHQNQPTDPPEK